jgi:hypothetical protein
MTCRWARSDHASRVAEKKKTAANKLAQEKRFAELRARTPDPDQYQIVEIEAVGKHLVVMVRYPSCANCAYDQNKVMVFPDITIRRACFWTRIDPQFDESARSSTHAPSPMARFPGSQSGWDDAIAYAGMKS